MIPFNKSPYTGTEDTFVLEAIKSSRLCGDGPFTKKCHQWFGAKLGTSKVFLTPSCTHALEMAAMLIDVRPGDEIIMPSYTFVSTANAFVLRGAKIVFVDIRPDTMNLDEKLIDEAITVKTKAIVPVHYAGVACEMDAIMEIAERRSLFVIEDAAQGVMSEYKGRPLGTIGHIGAYSFHETKNYTSGGEGGLLIVNDERFAVRAEIIREKGTNRSAFFRGMVDKYSWVDVGSSYLPSELQAAYLWGQLQKVDEINRHRLAIWDEYRIHLSSLHEQRRIDIPLIPQDCVHNAHMFFIKLESLAVRTSLIEHLKGQGIQTAFHYVPLHSSKCGIGAGRFHGIDRHTTLESERLLRLPIWYGLKIEDIKYISQAIIDFFKDHD
ncbi:MAG: dTDP-4-amino-4,6-dideoxygalactose transaminase [Alphaproteobacteria bacterium]|nr:dTDP-4-amino-4,6-dideoxygalactose transaminase [Alphaproteobacteria bacterium]MBP6366717.1 dTDP-4-amino-4,6-dideoxygalactose transaminase [Nitrosomonas sp.]